MLINISADYKNESGFTLIEVAVVLVIIGVLVASFIGTVADRIETTRRDNATRQLLDIKQALLGFASAEGRLPCPATAVSNGVAQPPGGGVCTRQHGFLPGRTLGLSGAYNRDNLLIDAWGNPIRYTVATANSSAFTRPVGPGNGGMKETGMATLSPALTICNGDSTSSFDCVGSDKLIDTAPFIVISLGKDGSEFAGTAAPNSDQGENAGEAVVSANSTGENIAYTVGSNRIFVSRGYSREGSAAGQFDDIVLWVSPYVLYSRMIEAGQLP